VLAVCTLAQIPSESPHRTRTIGRDDRGIVGVEPLGPHRLGFFSVHTVLEGRRGLTVPACPGDRRNKYR